MGIRLRMVKTHIADGRFLHLPRIRRIYSFDSDKTDFKSALQNFVSWSLPRFHFFPRRKYALSSASLFRFDFPSVRLLSCLLGIVALHICAVKKGAGRRCWRRRRLNVENSFLSVVVLLLQRETGREEVFFWRVQNEWCSGANEQSGDSMK